MKFYKIGKVVGGNNELFSTGGAYPRFTKLGKVWQRRSDVTRHLTAGQAVNPRRSYQKDALIYQLELRMRRYVDCYLYEWDTEEGDCTFTPIHLIIEHLLRKVNATDTR